MTRRPRDSQRQAVYRWEQVIRDRFPEACTPMTLEECRALVNRVWYEYVALGPAPLIKDGRGCKCAWGSRWFITLPCWARNPIVVLHELAHAILDYYSYKDAIHGPVFATFVLDLWATHTDIPEVVVRRMGETQMPRRVRFAELGTMPRRLTHSKAADRR